MSTKKGKAKPRLVYISRRKGWEAVPPKGYRITGTLSYAEEKVFVGIKKMRREADSDG